MADKTGTLNACSKVLLTAAAGSFNQFGATTHAPAEWCTYVTVRASYPNKLTKQLSAAICELAKGHGVSHAAIQLLRNGSYSACEAHATDRPDNFRYFLIANKGARSC